MPLVLLASTALWAAGPKPVRRRFDPMADEMARMKQLGFSVRQKISAKIGDVRLDAIIFSQWKGRFDRLQIYEVGPRLANLIYTYPGMGKRLQFGPGGARSAIADVYHDGTRTITFTSSPGSTPGAASDLHRLRYQSGRVLTEFRPPPN